MARDPLKKIVRKRSQRKVALDGQKCKMCGSTENLERHHFSYKTDKVTILCRDCHYKLHHTPKQNKRRLAKKTVTILDEIKVKK